jgi:hypothetical protein
MQGFKSQAATKPTAMGSLLQASTYGATIPVIYGQTQSPLLAIWAANLRQGGSSKKGKGGGSKKKGGPPTYVENVDFLLGHNPIMAVLQAMVNGSLYPLTFKSYVGGGLDAWYSRQLTIPDSLFYAIIAVTVTQTYSFDVDDYGGQGPQTLTGTWERPFWNSLEHGPDPANPSGIRNDPWLYRWQPSDGPTITFDNPPNGMGGGNVNVYYAAVSSSLDYQPPIAKLQCAFEAELGSGSEYADANLGSQQITYPHFAGIGSSDVDLGSSGALPQIQPEVRGKWGIYPSGDADFADMIEDIFKSGMAQAAIGSSTAFTQMERGLSSYNLPGCVQHSYASRNNGPSPVTYPQPNTAGNFLVCCAYGFNVLDPPTISDTEGNIWTLAAGTTTEDGQSRWAIWYCKGVGGANTVSCNCNNFTNGAMLLLEIAGVDSLEAIIQVDGVASASINTTNEIGTTAYLLALPVFTNEGFTSSSATPAGWSAPFTNGGQYYQTFNVQERRVGAPGTYSITETSEMPGHIVLMAFKSSQPVSYPKPVGDFIDLDSLNLVRQQCRANGLWGSLSMNSQSAASDWLKTLYQAANAAPVYLGRKLYSFPYSEVSTAGNGATYTASTASGPAANLDAANGDFVGTDGCPKLLPGSRVNLPNVLQMQCLDRNSNYNQVVVQQPDAASIALFGVRKADPLVNNAVQDPSIARTLLGIQVRRNQYGGDRWAFTASPRWGLLTPMDLITLTDELQCLGTLPVRIVSYEEQDDGSFQGTAEPFVYGMCAPATLTATTPTTNPTDTMDSAGNVNAPVIFEATAALSGLSNQGQLWIAVSSPAANYGGCQSYVSTDGGNSYDVLGDPLVGSATTGVTTADWPAAADPDSTNNLTLDLTESNGSLLSYAAAVRDADQCPCYVAGGGSYAIPYELMAYNNATLTAANKYTLMATGSGNELRRGVFGAPAAGVGVDHPSGSRFAFLSSGAQGILKYSIPAQYIGVELFFKFVTFNSFGTAVQSLADVTAYTYTPTGAAGTGAGSVFQVNGS